MKIIDVREEEETFLQILSEEIEPYYGEKEITRCIMQYLAMCGGPIHKVFTVKSENRITHIRTHPLYRQTIFFLEDQRTWYTFHQTNLNCIRKATANFDAYQLDKMSVVPYQTLTGVEKAILTKPRSWWKIIATHQTITILHKLHNLQQIISINYMFPADCKMWNIHEEAFFISTFNRDTFEPEHNIYLVYLEDTQICIKHVVRFVMSIKWSYLQCNLEEDTHVYICCTPDNYHAERQHLFVRFPFKDPTSLPTIITDVHQLQSYQYLPYIRPSYVQDVVKDNKKHFRLYYKTLRQCYLQYFQEENDMIQFIGEKYLPTIFGTRCINMTVNEKNKIWILLFDGRVYELNVDQITSWNDDFVPTQDQEENKEYDETVKNYIKNSKQF